MDFIGFGSGALADWRKILVAVVVAWYSIVIFKRILIGSQKSEKTILVVLGSGGHTSEIIKMLEDWKGKICAVCADGDFISQRQFLDRFDGKVYFVFRSRKVGQSYFTSVFTTLYSFLPAFGVVWKEKPSLVISNGPGIALPICYVAWFMKFVSLEFVKIVYVESFCRTTSLSLAGKLIYPISSEFFVQWEKLHEKYPKTRYIGLLSY